MELSRFPSVYPEFCWNFGPISRFVASERVGTKRLDVFAEVSTWDALLTGLRSSASLVIVITDSLIEETSCWLMS